VAPLLAAAVWRLGSARRRLRRTVLACVLRTAEELEMTVVGAPDVLRRPGRALGGEEAPQVGERPRLHPVPELPQNAMALSRARRAASVASVVVAGLAAAARQALKL
jgi:hypothetical protein